MKHNEILSQPHYMAHHTMWYLVDLTEKLNAEKSFVYYNLLLVSGWFKMISGAYIYLELWNLSGKYIPLTKLLQIGCI